MKPRNAWKVRQLWRCHDSCAGFNGEIGWNGYGSIPINTIFRGMNIHKSQLFWCELQGYKVLTHCQMKKKWWNIRFNHKPSGIMSCFNMFQLYSRSITTIEHSAGFWKQHVWRWPLNQGGFWWPKQVDLLFRYQSFQWICPGKKTLFAGEIGLSIGFQLKILVKVVIDHFFQDYLRWFLMFLAKLVWLSVWL